MFCCLLTSSPDAAMTVAHACSPRVMRRGDAAIFDVMGCARTIGPPETIAREVARLAADQGQDPRVAIAPTVTAAWLLAHARPGTTVAAPDGHVAALGNLPLGWLGTLVDLDHTSSARRAPYAAEFQDRLAILERWGLRTLGSLAALPRADVHARLGPVGVRMHQAACGQDAVPFAPMEAVRQFTDRLVLEWPIEGLEPLAFVLARSCERLSAALQQADRGAVTIRTRLWLVTRETHARTLHLPTPLADPRLLRTLILLDLESHPPPAAIDVVTIDFDVSPGPVVQGSLVAPTLPSSEDLATLLARLGALMGESRLGSPLVLDTHDTRAVGMTAFRMPRQSSGQPAVEGRRPCLLPVALRQFRVPVAARVVVEHHAPVRVVPSARGLTGGAVVRRAGPWRTSGGWWRPGRGAWDRDEWDVELAGGEVYRLARDRSTDRWLVEGILD